MKATTKQTRALERIAVTYKRFKKSMLELEAAMDDLEKETVRSINEKDSSTIGVFLKALGLAIVIIAAALFVLNRDKGFDWIYFF